MGYDRCPKCDSYKIEYTGVYHAGCYEIWCDDCYFHGASSWEPFIAPYPCTIIGVALRSYISQYANIEYIKGLQS